MLRLAFWILVIANAVYFAWSQGYLATLGLAPTELSEPERLRSQIKPQSLRLLNGPGGGAPAVTAPPTNTAAHPNPAIPGNPEAPVGTEPGTRAAVVTPPAPAAEPTACWLASGFTPAQARALRGALAASALPRSAWQLDEQQTGGRWVVYMGRFTPQQMERKKTELLELGIEFRTLPPPLGPALALGTYSSEAGAQQALQEVIQKGVRTVRVVQERDASSVWTLHLPAVTGRQREAVASLAAATGTDRRLRPCE